MTGFTTTSLSGGAGSSSNLSCANVYTIGGNLGGATSQTFVCSLNPDGISSSWSPDPSRVFCQCMSLSRKEGVGANIQWILVYIIMILLSSNSHLEKMLFLSIL